jgi:hypothetical protein
MVAAVLLLLILLPTARREAIEATGSSTTST